MVADPRARMSKFISGVSDLLSKECKVAILVKEIDISQLMTYAEWIEEEKIRERARDSKRIRVDGGGYSHQISEGYKFQSGQKQSGQGSTNTFLPIHLR